MGFFLTLIIAIAYGAGAFRFWNGFHRTHYNNNKVSLTLLWPFFLVANKSYRQNFSRALKG